MDIIICSSLIKWLQTFPGHSNISSKGLSDGVALGKLLHMIAPEYFTEQWLTKIKTDVGENWRLKLSNLHKIHEGVVEFYSDQVGTTPQQSIPPDLKKIGEHADEKELGSLLQLVLGCAINCKNKQNHIERIMGMEEGVQTVMVNAIQDLMNKDGAPSSMDGSMAASAEEGLPSFHPHVKSLMQQLESTSIANEHMNKRCHEMDHQISLISEERNTLRSENEKLLERVDILEKGGDFGSSRYSDLRKQVEGLQDELYKTESAREEYKIRVDDLEKVVSEVMTKNEELQFFADEAKALKDEVDALRGVNDKVSEYETTIETFKRRLEELSDLRRQVKILEEKNSNYMQNNLELEEEIKKTGTLRPQVEILRKQMTDLHQKLADETKHKDKVSFDNKKILEKLDAATQERDRIMLERFELQKNLEELNCSNTAHSSSRSPSDLNDLDALEIVSPEIREKLMRLQHENRQLKKKVTESAEESSPVLESMLNDLQDRFDRLQQENRWSKPYPSPTTRTNTSYGATGVRRPLRHLKWASETDLRPTNPIHFLTPSSTLPPKRFTPPAREPPIIIRHIHEFKMASSPTNEDSGCCRTSPSSCEGSDDSHLIAFDSRDYNGTLDSGVSSICRCISPTIPSIIEECTTYHMSDIIPAAQSHPIMTHTHPAHRCCSPKPFDSKSVRPVSMTSESSVSDQMSQPKVVEIPAREAGIVSAPSKPILQMSALSHSNASESPTPHNSPKLPHSVHFHRSKGHRHSIATAESPVATTQSPAVKTKRSKSVDKSKSRSEHKYRIDWTLDDARAVSNRYKDVYPSKMRERFVSHEHTSSGESSQGSKSKSTHRYESPSASNWFSTMAEQRPELVRNNPLGCSIRRKQPQRRSSVDNVPTSKHTNRLSLCSLSPAHPPKAILETSLSAEVLRKSSRYEQSPSRRFFEFDQPSNEKLGTLKKSKESLHQSNNDVKILTDSLFTHFMVAPTKLENHVQKSSIQSLPAKQRAKAKPSSRRGSESIIGSASDIYDELLELKLATCAFGAPLVTSESLTSFLQSDVTDYSASEDEFNPHQFKLLESSDVLSPLVPILPAKNKTRQKKPTLTRGVVKIKNNKTTKAIVAETMNAMFAFCTP